jgi:hypothetical protein
MPARKDRAAAAFCPERVSPRLPERQNAGNPSTWRKGFLLISGIMSAAKASRLETRVFGASMASVRDICGNGPVEVTRRMIALRCFDGQSRDFGE